MADLDAYPPLRQLLDSSNELVDDVVIDRAVSGDVRGRSFYPTPKRALALVHAMSVAEWDALEAFYIANRNNRVTVTWCQTGAQYVCLFDGPPGKPSFPAPDIVRLTVKLVVQ